MTDLISIYVVAILFYLFDSVRRTGLQAVIFKPGWRAETHHAGFPAVYPSNGDWGWVVLSLLRPWNPLFISDPPETRLAPGGVLHGRLDDASRLRSSAWSGINAIQIEDDELKVGDHLLPCASPLFWRDAMRRLHKTPADKRENEIVRFLAAGFDLPAITKRLEEFRNAAGPLRLLTGSLLAAVAVIFPFLAFLLPPRAAVFAFAALLFAHSIWIAVRFHRAHRVLYQRPARWTAWKMALYPIAAIRAMDELARDLLAPFHSFALTAALCGKPGWAVVGRRSLRDALFPVNAGPEDELGVEILGWYSRQILSHLQERIARMKLSQEVLPRQPERHNPSIGSYCPRCLSQFQFSAGVCPDCSSVRLVAFPGQEAARP